MSEKIEIQMTLTGKKNSQRVPVSRFYTLLLRLQVDL
jgi:hypothetical protein